MKKNIFTVTPLGNRYCLTFPSRKTAYIDRNTDALAKLEKYLDQTESSLTWHGGCIRASKGDQRRLADIMTAIYWNLAVDDVERRFVRHRDGDVCNCTKRNLSYLGRLNGPDMRLVYETPFNVLYSNGARYLLLCKYGGIVVKMDHIEANKNLIIDLMRTGHRFSLKPRQHMYAYAVNGQAMKLAAYLLDEQYHLPLTSISAATVKYEDGNPLNLMRYNLVCNAVPAGNTANRSVRRAGDKVYVWLNNGLSHYTDCADKMDEIVRMPIMSWHSGADGRLAADIRTDGKSCGVPPTTLYWLRWATEYYGAKADYFSIAKSLKTMQRDFAEGGYQLDHLDGNYRNCCLWNLEKMTISQNAQKGSLTSKIRTPFFWFSAQVDGKLRIAYGDDLQNPKFCVCDTPDEYIALLKSFYANGLGGDLPPKSIEKGKRIGYHPKGWLDADGEAMIRRLLAMSENDFISFA